MRKVLEGVGGNRVQSSHNLLYVYFPDELWKFSTASIFKKMVSPPSHTHRKKEKERRQRFLNQMEILNTPRSFTESSLGKSSYLKQFVKIIIKLIKTRIKENRDIAMLRSCLKSL